MRVSLKFNFLLSAVSIAFLLCVSSVASSEQLVTTSLSVSSGPWVGQREVLGQSANSSYSLSISDQKYRYKYNFEVSKESNSENLQLDGSFLEFKSGSWNLGFGLKERHWSPSGRNSLILSRNGRPFQSFYITTDSNQNFNTKYLSWIGSWEAEVFLGSLEKNRLVEHTKIVGARFKFEPINNLEIDLVRTAQFGGKGKSENLKTLFGLILGQDDNGDEPNQLAGLGIAYSVLKNGTESRIYAQVIGEDEAGYLPTCHMYLAGFELTSIISSVPTKLVIEGLDTVISTTPSGFCGPNTAYNNSYYPSGYTHYGKVLGASIDTASRALTVALEHKFPFYDLMWSISKTDINVPSLSGHRLSSKASSGYDLEIGARFKLYSSEILSLMHYQGSELDTAGIKKGVKLSLSLSRDF